MEYRVTCKNCGFKYRFRAEAGQTIICQCPNCGQKMRVNLPSENKSETVASGIPDTPEPQGNNHGEKKSGKSTTNVLLVILLVVVVGFIAWFAIQQKHKNDEQARIELQEARKAHMDSLMALRNQQEAEEKAAQEKMRDQEETISFLNEFYAGWLSGSKTPADYEDHLSQSCYDRLHKVVIYENEDGTNERDSVEWSRLLPYMSSMQGKSTEQFISEKGEDLLSSLSINHYDGNWYRINMSANGEGGSREIEAFPQNGRVIINDFR